MGSDKHWAAFPWPAKAFDYDGPKLEKAWPKLHAGDREPFPDEALVARRLRQNPDLARDAAAAAGQLQEAWRAFHRGDFRQAFDIGVSLGPLGASVACKAGGIHATRLLEDDRAKLSRYEALIGLAEASVQAMPSDPNAHFRRAFAIGRYSQCISVAKALQQGLAGKVRESLETTLEIAPDHAEAHTAMGLYHAEIIAKVGAVIGGLTYGAKAATGEKHLLRALELTPDAPIAHIEYGNGLLLLHGDRREHDAARAYENASRLKPRDAMEKLDVEFAKSQLEE